MFTLHEILENDCLRLAESELNLILLMNDKNYPWFILVPKRENKRELFELTEEDQNQFIKESSAFSKIIYKQFNGEKLNVAALGNMVPQLHIHHIVRYKTDSAWPGPIWGKVPSVAYSENEILEMKKKLSSELEPLFRVI